MARHLRIALLFVPSLVVSAPVLAQDASVLLQQLRSTDGNARQEAAGKLAGLGAEVIAPLFELVGDADQTLAKTAEQAVETLTYAASAPDAGPRRAAVAEALAKEAASPRPDPVRLYALRMVGFVGGDEVVPTLAKLLADPKLGEIARLALARIPGKAATAALADALPNATPEGKVGLLNALASRAARALLHTFTAAATDKDEGVRIAAYDALSRLPDPAAAPAIQKGMKEGSDREKTEAIKAYVRLGDTLVAAGQQSAARRVFQECVGSGDEFTRAAGVAGIGRAGGPGTTALLLGALADGSAVVKGAAKQALVDVKGDDVAKAIGEAYASAPPEARATLLWVLGERKDRAGESVLLRGLTDPESAVRVAAYRALGTLGDPATIEPILGALSKGAVAEPPAPGSELAAAEWAISRIPGQAVTRAIDGAAIRPDPRVGVILGRVLGTRGDRSVTPTLLTYLGDKDESVRVTGIEALGRLRSPEAVKPLIQMLAKPDSAEAKAAEAALSHFTAPDTTKTLVEALATSPDAVRAGIIRALSPREDKGLTDTFIAAAKDKSDDVAVAALEALGRLRDEKAAPVFLDVAQNGSDRAKQAAVRAYLKIAEARQDQDGAAALAIYQRALEIATGDDERKQAILGLGRVGDVAQLAIVEPYLNNANLRDAAATAIVPLADKVAKAGDKGRAIALYKQAVEAGKDRNVVRAAAQKLRELGVPLDLAAGRGCITQWWVVGPFPGREQATKNDYVATDKPVDVTDIVEYQNRNLHWKFAPVDDPLGMIDFEKTVARMDDCGTYAYAEVKSDQERDVLLKIGSDDSVFIWLNGRRIHAWDGNRGWAEDQDTVDAHLKAGWNTVLAKVINGGAQWSLSVRVTDKDGRPIVLEQKKP